MGVLEEEAKNLMTICISWQQEASKMFEKIKVGVYKYDKKIKKEGDVEIEYLGI